MTHIFRLQNGQDLLQSIKGYCEHKKIDAGVIVSSVGCVHNANIRDARGFEVHEIDEPMEIISINGTVGRERCHLHISLSTCDLTVIGGHLVDGCVVYTTAEIAIMEIPDLKFSKRFDKSTGYNELEITQKEAK